MKYCDAIGCKKSIIARSWCRAHYLRWYRHGNTDKIRIKNIDFNSGSYISWRGMKDRCLNKNSIRYSHYGNRDITICEQWLGVDGFKNFLKDMGERPKNMSLDRENNNGNYEPSNCRWATNSTQIRNRGLSKLNTSGFRGIDWSKSNKSWRVRIMKNNKVIWTKNFKDINVAAKAQREISKQIFPNIRTYT